VGQKRIAIQRKFEALTQKQIEPSIDKVYNAYLPASTRSTIMHSKTNLLLVGLALKRKALGVHDVPVEYVVLGIGQSVDGLLDKRNGLEVTGRVQKHTCVVMWWTEYQLRRMHKLKVLDIEPYTKN